MYVRRVIAPRIVIWFAWRPTLAFLALNLAVYGLFEGLGWKFVAIPFLPVATIGTAVAFYVGFKNNSSYERIWEARKIWGGIEATSKAWGIHLCELVGGEDRELSAIRKELVYGQIAWVNLVRLRLRGRSVWGDAVKKTRTEVEIITRCHGEGSGKDEVREVLETFAPGMFGGRTPDERVLAMEVLQVQLRRITRLRREGRLEETGHARLAGLIVEMLNQEAAAERIKSFPFPRQYACFSPVFVIIFLVLLPFAMVGEMSQMGGRATWLAVPFGVLISWVFMTMEQVGDSSENPFEGAINDVPLTAICREIEVALRASLGEESLPESLRAVNGLLM